MKNITIICGVIVIIAGIFCAGYFTGKRLAEKSILPGKTHVDSVYADAIASIDVPATLSAHKKPEAKWQTPVNIDSIISEAKRFWTESLKHGSDSLNLNNYLYYAIADTTLQLRDSTGNDYGFVKIGSSYESPLPLHPTSKIHLYADAHTRSIIKTIENTYVQKELPKYLFGIGLDLHPENSITSPIALDPFVQLTVNQKLLFIYWQTNFRSIVRFQQGAYSFSPSINTTLSVAL